jgi:ATP-binding cassette subfamily G (WHITE) protein 2
LCTHLSSLACPNLGRRCLKEQQRRWRTTLVQLLQSLAMAALIGGVFFQIGTTQASTAKRLPVLFFCCINQVRRRLRPLRRDRAGCPQR